LMGRKTWQAFSKLWPNRTDDFSAAMNRIPKLVVSHAETDLSTWVNSSPLSGDLVDAVAAHKSEHDVIVVGSASIVHALAEKDLVDEYRIIIFPDLVGNGTRLFTSEATATHLRLISAETAGPTILMRYAHEALS